jgi:phosphoglycolate phosphatase
MNNSGKVNAVLFDLDGTLIDTAPDMATALNFLLQKHGRATLSFDNIRNTVSKGSAALVKLGFGHELAEADQKRLQQEFLDTYSNNLYKESRLFDGMPELLQHLEQNAIPWGIVTNKPGWLTQPLLECMDLWQRSAFTVSGDDLPRRKPHPDPLLHACQAIGCEPKQTLYIGDDQRDIDAGNAAEMHTLIAAYGYIDTHEKTHQWGADGIIHSVNELRQWLDVQAS